MKEEPRVNFVLLWDSLSVVSAPEIIPHLSSVTKKDLTNLSATKPTMTLTFQ